MLILGVLIPYFIQSSPLTLLYYIILFVFYFIPNFSSNSKNLFS
nr:MAG TPA: hypothetical protein [Caudoviricetes sp.]